MSSINPLVERDGVRLPRVKDEHRPHRLESGAIRIGGEVYGLAAEIDDPNGWAWAALDLMDGTRDCAEIAERLSQRFPGLSAAAAGEIVRLLVASGYVEDAGAVPPASLSPREQVRYSRNKAYFRRVDLAQRGHGWEAQLRLRAARVVVLGLGGTGSHAAWALAAAGVGWLHCVDSDEVELSNLSRQVLYDENDVGRAKSTAIVARLRALNSDITVTAARQRITSRQDLAELIRDADMLALCADEPRASTTDLPPRDRPSPEGRARTTLDGQGIRIWANRECAAAGTPWAGGGYSGPLVTVGVFGPTGPCYECVNAGERARRPRGMPVDLGGPGAIAPSAGISGQLVAQAVISQLTGIPPVPPGYIRGVNLLAPDHLVYVRHPARRDCPICRPESTLH
jgi:molybdopterin/thiamine biosynthesis adenylyltransferase